MSSATAGPSPPPQAAAALLDPSTPAQVEARAGTFRFLDGRVQASVEMPRHTPDMSIPAAAALRAVLRGRWARENHQAQRRCQWTAPTRWAMRSAQARRAGRREPIARRDARHAGRRGGGRRGGAAPISFSQSTCCSSLKRTLVRPAVQPIDVTTQRHRATVGLVHSLCLAEVGHRQQLESIISRARELGLDRESQCTRPSRWTCVT